jgi:UDP-N-acetylmuramate--alanine ligase
MAIAGITRPTIPNLTPQERADAGHWHSAHLVGVCGSGMKALAELLTAKGWMISGSDINASEAVVVALANRGLRVHPGHEAGFLPVNADVLVYSPAVGPDNVERQRAARLGIPQLSYSQMLALAMRERQGVCIAGTHGKSTTTAMAGCILTAAGMAPDVVVGAEIREIARSGWSGGGLQFVVESCEYQKSFLDLSPQYAAILGIEPDHFDCYPHFDEAVASFAAFAHRVPGDGRLLIPLACEASKAASMAARAPVETFAVEAAGVPCQADWLACDLRPTREGTRFRVFHRGDFFAEISLRIPGIHNIANALAAAALAQMTGAETAAIRDALSDFPGICRRFEPVGLWRGVTLIDDYAHHPTAVAATLETARDRFRGRRLWCVFQPHQISRTEALFAEFARQLTIADHALLVPVFAARENVHDEPAVVSRRLAGQIVEAGGAARFVPTLDQAVATLEDELLPGDVLVTMGAGDIAKVHHGLTRSLQRLRPPRRTSGALYLAENRREGAISRHPADTRRTG